MKYFNILALTFAVFVAVVAASSSSLRMEVADIAKQADGIKTLLNKNDKSYDGVIAVDTASRKLDESLQKAAKDAQAEQQPVNDADGSAIAQSMSNLAGSVQAVSEKIISIKPYLQKLSPSAIKQTHDDLAKTNGYSKAFGNALVAKMPASSKSAVQNAQSQIEAAQQKAIAAYTG